MPVVRELFGRMLTDSGTQGAEIRSARCPHMDGQICDGGGNRDMMRWPSENQPLAPLFVQSVGKEGGGFIPCGVCSVDIGDKVWAVCPRRLLTLDAPLPSPQQRTLRNRVLRLAGFRDGDAVCVWSEVSLRHSSVNYRLDYVLRGDGKPPVIVEIMTASTSGGNKRARTDMQSAFCDAVLYANGLLPDRRSSPGVNTRQVWARMASQMIVKSEIANRWGGSTIWVVQDSLMDYIGEQTGLRIDALRSSEWETQEVNVIAANIDVPSDLTLYAGPIHARSPGEACWTELLSAPAVPPVDVLTDKLTDHNVSARFIFEDAGKDAP